MNKLNFYTIDLDYVDYLKEEEENERGFSRVPDMRYDDEHKPKFVCGVVLRINNQNYYVPVSSYKTQKPDNFLLKDKNGKVTGSLRFNYMFPAPNSLIKERTIKTEPDIAYRILLSQELIYCKKNQSQIRNLAERTYKRVMKGKDPGLVINSCDFSLLEEKCKEYIQANQLEEGINQPVHASFDSIIKSASTRLK